MTSPRAIGVCICAMAAGIAVIAVVRQPTPPRDENPIPLVFLDTPHMQALEDRGMGFFELLSGSEVDDDSTQAMRAHPAYRDIRLPLLKEIHTYRERVGRDAPDYQHRFLTFPKAWLSSPNTGFELVGVVLRPDRLLQAPTSCGQLRLVYRLRYQVEGPPVQSSRLPMTAMIVYDLPGGHCHRKWRSISDNLASGQLPSVGRLEISSWPITQVEVNLQIARLPQLSADAPLEQGHYLLRIFRRTPAGFRAALLENTVDVEKISGSAALRSELLAWIRAPENLAAIESGAVRIPDKFLATSAVSVAPYGLNRIINKPYSAVFTEDDFSDLDFSYKGQPHELAANPRALVRRLDTLSCQGCHQSRAIAGFHLLGNPEQPNQSINALKVPFSNHFGSIQQWRSDFALRVQAEQPPRPVPFSERPLGRVPGKRGAHCSYGEINFPWDCAKGLSCYVAFPESIGKEIGTCHPAKLTGLIGQPCDWADVESHVDPLKDQLRSRKRLPCGENGICANGQEGFPGGLCSAWCPDGRARDGAVCVPGPKLKTFTPCLRSGRTFKDCFETEAELAQFAACDRDMPCRDDYACAQVSPHGPGACLPPYTLPQLIIEFHPDVQ